MQIDVLCGCCVQGVIVYFRVVDGQLRAGDIVKLMNTGKEYQVDEVGVLAPKQVPVRGFDSACSLACSMCADRVSTPSSVPAAA
jgi:hypothetical protein